MEEKENLIEKIVVGGKSFNVADDNKQLDKFQNIPDVLRCSGKIGEIQVIDESGKIVLVKFKCLSSRFLMNKNGLFKKAFDLINNKKA